MDEKKLEEVLDSHKLWKNGDSEGKQADLHGADLRWAELREADLNNACLRNANLCRAKLVRADLEDADLRGADLSYSELHFADLRGADLREADLDFSSWPLWRGSFDVRVDARIAAQLAYHFCCLDCDDTEYIKARNAILDFANTFHRVGECGKLEKVKEK